MVSKSGFSIIELMMAVGVFGIVVAALASMNVRMRQDQTRTASLFHLSVISKNLYTLASTQNSWMNSLNSPQNQTAMACLKNRTQCTSDGQPNSLPKKDIAFALLDGAGNVFFDAANPANGFSLAGTPCNTYSAAGNDECPIRFDLKWSAQCVPPNCIDPQVKVEAQIKYSPATNRLVIKESNYQMNPLYRTAQ